MAGNNPDPSDLNPNLWNPSSSTSSSAPTPSSSTTPQLVLLSLAPHLPHLIVRPPPLEAAIQEARDLFEIKEDVKVLLTVMWKGRRVVLTARSWDIVLQQAEGEELELEVQLPAAAPVAVPDFNERKRQAEEAIQAARARRQALAAQRVTEAQPPAIPSPAALPSASLLGSPPPYSTAESKITLTLIHPNNPALNLNTVCLPTTSMSKIYRAYAERTGMHDGEFFFTIDDERIRMDWTVGHAIREASPFQDRSYRVDVRLEQKGGKPVIYLFPPTAIDASVRLSLVPSWKFSAIYPLTEITPTRSKGETLTWNVTASPDGTLATPDGDTLSYLFWEAHTVTPIRPELDCTATILSLTSFDPLRPNLTSSNSILLPFEPFLRHLSSALKSLTLHTSARNDFITYWLPSFIAIRDRGQHILMRFLEQEQYEKSAPLEVKPRPDVVTRVFMIFKGVEESECEEEKWREARELAEKVNWRKVVGVSEAAEDEGKFRVLEWGGMEVVR